ncbi:MULTISPECIES: dTDP-4-dehydrorhamnose 3,5-epimerase [Priestia]|uniref:dTDP-4-dehydrorhamnose 3,5-epimerase n=1 Tax=Priestia TaxID=2800373 RepID=UPI0013E36431|nr:MULTISPECIES: dTDP-4-dehydrorhamnose 3,5-epimerase [Priestia]MBX9998605.1 dTDP-4-dehydrorhamnose 3,5-epimerase [Priestia aryabhattai]MED3865135.1 dTDP-4-dehydrorhamnose 3,5-epimerase [Priestia megaterium]MED4100484.1 dTDP-4-dehydrorhamnose 3,5-epimerase [Priestia megaterium]MED4144465.1 dTDP-4-dehydrorhamnose 3,5-epimerase [Priestia megaterium]MED4165764.1 dTDP-4-dehydrorhamnose 3,5-epimerase [Priestia megaterium]
MNIIKTKFEDAILIEPKVFGDHRGFFTESYNKEMFQQNGIDMDFIQDNHSLSQQPGTLRGMHYQLNDRAQTKLVRVTRGAIYDVIVDIRKGSPTYGEWQGFILSADNKRQLLVPKGFAHGFCTIVENTEVQYKVDELYSPEHDRGIAWNDPALNIDWPFNNPVLSDKDTKHPTLAEADNNFTWE